ncbi:CPBP family intramembrane glutamic endopeptidase [Lysinimonas soli]|uniref:CPBP family intramembrane glutamic endopeptidase n=1 Tax=Lysinimonas soli TaxID=1074233 RepID=A0ABW0NLT9_9MICO
MGPTSVGVDLRPDRGRLWWEIALVLGLSLGQSAVYAIVSLADSLTRSKPLSQQTATLNPSLNDREVFDLIYQLLGLVFDVVPVLLVCFLLWNRGRPHLARLGIDARRPFGDAWRGLALALVIGIPGIGVYLAAKALDLGVTVDAAGLSSHWWTVPVLLLSAFRAGLLEEVIVLGYLFERLRELGWGRWRIIVAAALLRGSYHLYQGFGAFVGNVLMGLLFGYLFSRSKRVLPFVIAHFVIDAAIFVGYPWAVATFPELFGVVK